MVMVVVFGLLTISTLVVVYLRIKSASTLFQHLTVEDIKEYKRGHVSEDDRRHVTRHISYCAKCRQLMLDTDPDDTIDHLVE
jgi:hypothetical protein